MTNTKITFYCYECDKIPSGVSMNVYIKDDVVYMECNDCGAIEKNCGVIE